MIKTIVKVKDSFTKNYWGDPVWSKVIAAAIIAIASSVFFRASKIYIYDIFINWVSGTTVVYNYWFVLIPVLSLCILFLYKGIKWGIAVFNEHPQAAIITPSTNTLKQVLERIGFEKGDSPMDEDWAFIKDTSNGGAQLTTIADGTYGRNLKIEANGKSFIERIVNPIATQATIVEYLVKPMAPKFVFYLKLTVINKASKQSKDVWLCFDMTTPEVTPLHEGSGEWSFPATNPEILESGWVRFIFNIPNATDQTFGISGWSFLRVIKVRIRGNAQIRNIVFKS